VTISPATLDDTVERVNITLPRRVLRRLDEKARAAGETRSGHIASSRWGDEFSPEPYGLALRGRRRSRELLRSIS
jgi:hypothetical protein